MLVPLHITFLLGLLVCFISDNTVNSVKSTIFEESRKRKFSTPANVDAEGPAPKSVRGKPDAENSLLEPTPDNADAEGSILKSTTDHVGAVDLTPKSTQGEASTTDNFGAVDLTLKSTQGDTHAGDSIPKSTTDNDGAADQTLQPISAKDVNDVLGWDFESDHDNLDLPIGKGFDFQDSKTLGEGPICHGKLCKIVKTKADGHCYYHAIVISAAFSQHLHQQEDSVYKIIAYNLRIIFNDVFNTYNFISRSYGISGEEGSYFDEDNNVLIDRGQHVNKQAALEQLMSHDGCPDTISAWKIFADDSPQILFLHGVMLYLSSPLVYSTKLHSVDSFRELTSVPGISSITPIADSTNINQQNQQSFKKNAVCIVSHGAHYSGLDCRPQGALAEPEHEFNFLRDKNILQQIDVAKKVTCGKSQCTIREMQSTTSNYYDALLQSLGYFSKNKNIKYPLKAGILVQRAIISMNILGDLNTFIDAFNFFEVNLSENQFPNFRYVAEVEVNEFVRALHNMFRDKFTPEVRNYIEQQKTNKDMRQYIFYIYTYANNWGLHTDPLATMIQEKVEIIGVSQIKTITDASGVQYGDANHSDDIVCVYQTRVTGPGDNKKWIYLGVECEN